jgi:putative ABC transport system permease protein
MLFTEAEFFTTFSFPLASGNPASALGGPNDLVLTPEAAQKLFGNADPVGQTVEYFHTRWREPGQWIPLTVTAVALDPPPHSTIQFEAVARFEARNNDAYGDPDSWGMRWLQTYVRLHPGSDVAAFTAALPDRLADADPNNSDDSFWGRQYYVPVPIADTYFSVDTYGSQFTGKAAFMRLFGLIALAVLIIAVLNYVNLATARGLRMAREVGVRKAVGAGRGQVARQLLVEALLLVTLAFVVAVGIVLLVLPLFNTFFGKEVVLGWDALPVWAGALVLMLGVGLLAGAYPALALSRFNPARVLKSGPTGAAGGAWLRRGLVVTQFAATIGLLVFTGFVFRQLGHLQSAYQLPDDARLAVVSTPYGWDSRTPTIKAALNDLPGVRGVAATSAVPGRVGMRFGISREEEEPLLMAAVMADRDYMRLMNFPMENEAPRLASDPPQRVYANQSLLRAMDEEWSPDLTIPVTPNADGSASTGGATPLAGVLTDLPYESLREPIQPLFIAEMADTSSFSYVVAEVLTGDLAAFQAALPGVWAQFSDKPPTVSFVDDYVADMYEAEAKLAQLVTLLALVALFIACLGLFGLAAHAAQTRRKEISVRKVLGAGVASLVGRLSREFALLVLAAFALAAPIAYLLVVDWLEGFVERTPVGPGVFALVLACALLLALATVSWHAWTAATRNPADVLRDE